MIAEIDFETVFTIISVVFSVGLVVVALFIEW